MPHGDPPEHCQSNIFPTLESINYCIKAAQDGLERAIRQNQAGRIITDWQKQLDNLLREKESFSPDNISSNMVIQKLDYFSIEGGRAIGQISFQATEDFNPFYYDKNIVSILQLKDRNGVNLIFKQNNLRFSLNQRDETIQFDESAHGQNYLSGQSFVWSNVSTPTPFSQQVQFEITGPIEEIPTPPIVTPPVVTPPVVTPPVVTPPIVTPPIVTPPIVTPPIVTPPIVTPPIDDSINTNMVTQQLINFNIINGRAVGSIKFVATNNFNPYYYNKEIINLVQFKTPNGVTLLVKENRLRFTQTERDEIINYDENIQENTRITVESFVWEWIDKPAGAFSNKYTIDISEKEPPKPIQAGFMGAGIAGAIAGLVLIGFIADHKRGK